MDPLPDFTPVDYPTWINDRIRTYLKAFRLARGLTPYGLAVPGKLSDQTILNIESGKHSPSLRMTAFYCQRLGTTLEAVFKAAFDEEPPL
jgi:DNA-binding XRE family transcriptional regulator